VSYKVLIPQDVAEIGKRYPTDRGYELKMGSGFDVETLRKDISDCRAILVRTASVDNIDVGTAIKLGIFVTNAPESNADSVAEHTTCLILAVIT